MDTSTPNIPKELTTEQKALVAEAEKAMKTHDWFYEYTEDRRVYRAGAASKSAMISKVCGLPQNIIDDLWAKHAPRSFKGAPPKSSLVASIFW